jgi:hypothetical protein
LVERLEEKTGECQKLRPDNTHDPLALTLATQTGMTNQWLKGQGLLSVKDLWVKIHYLATAR